MSSTRVDPSPSLDGTDIQSDQPAATKENAADLFHRLLHDGTICHYCFRRKRIVDEEEDEAEARYLYEMNPNGFHKRGHREENGEIIPENANSSRSPETTKEVVPGKAKWFGVRDGFSTNDARREAPRSQVVCPCGRLDYDGRTRSRRTMLHAVTQMHYRLHETGITSNLTAMKAVVKKAKSNPAVSGNDLDIFENAIYLGLKREDDRDPDTDSVSNIYR